MKKKTDKVLIIGGGVSGTAAARKLSLAGVEAHIVEKSPDIGGRAAEMGCKATDVCMRCNVCVADDLFRAVRESAGAGSRKKNGAARIYLHTSSELLELGSGANGRPYRAVLCKNGKTRRTLEIDSVIIAIGYEPFDPSQNSSFNYGNLANMITGQEAERQLAEHNCLLRPSDNTVPKKVAFIQCVGSRTEEVYRRPEDTNYCSTVCCSYALRIARLLKSQAGESEISVFYMDIQKFGKDFEKFYNKCKDEMRFVRSRPYEFRAGPNETVRVKFAAEQPDGCVCEEDFDLAVLSIGIRPPVDGLALSDKLGVATDEHGFFGLKRASDLPDLQKDGVYAVGASESPKDIAGCIEQAEAVSAVILGNLAGQKRAASKRGVNGDVAVLGGGVAGMRTALSLAELGHKTALILKDDKLGGRAAPELLGHLGSDPEETERDARDFIAQLIQAVRHEKRIRIYPKAVLKTVDGEQGSFSLTLNSGKIIRAGAIVLATGAVYASAKQGRSGSIVDFAGLLERIRTGDCGRKIAIIMDTDYEHGRDAWVQMLAAAELLSRRHGAQTTIYCRNVRVAATGMENLYRRVRESGTVVVKLDRKPKVSERDGRAVVKFLDAVSGMELCGEFDLAVVGTRMEWTQGRELFDKIAGLRTGPEGEAQYDNIWLMPGLTNRPGVFSVGAARGDTEYRAALSDGLAVAQEIHALLAGDGIRMSDDVAEVDPDKCVLCLTCLRVCPHGAITIDNEKDTAYPSPLSCKQCGTCVTECPACAITLPGTTDERITSKIGRKPGAVVFACENSAIPAAKAAGFKHKKHLKMIEVPCAGDVDPRMVLHALESGARKVIIIGCHPESCKYLSGSTKADRRTRRISDMLAKAGFDPSRVSFHGISSVEPKKFVEFMK